jgi:hypothetical protein
MTARAAQGCDNLIVILGFPREVHNSSARRDSLLIVWARLRFLTPRSGFDRTVKLGGSQCPFVGQPRLHLSQLQARPARASSCTPARARTPVVTSSEGAAFGVEGEYRDRGERLYGWQRSSGAPALSTPTKRYTGRSLRPGFNSSSAGPPTAAEPEMITTASPSDPE